MQSPLALAPRRRRVGWLGLTLLSAAAIAERAGAAPDAEPEAASTGVAVTVERVIGSDRDLGRGRFLRRLTGRGDQELFQRPYGVAWDGDDLLVTDPGVGQVIRIRDRKRRVGRSPEGLLQSPIGVAVCAPGIVVSDSATGKVALLDRDLRLVRWLAEGLERPTGIACRGERIFVVETRRHRLLVLDAATTVAGSEAPGRGGPTRSFGERGDAAGEFNFPTTVALDGGSLWVGDTLNFRLQRFDPRSGEFTAAFGQLGDAAGEMPRVKGVAVDGGGRLWLTDAYLDQIALYSSEGAFLTSLGRRGSGPGELSFPAGISIHADGRVAVADSLNRRLQILRIELPPATVEEGS